MSRVSRLNRLLPLVAIGTVADCQSIIDPTNRLLVKAGLKILASGNHGIVGLSELMAQTGLTAKIQSGLTLSSQDIAFTLSPILNSSGRMSHAYKSIASLLGTQDNDLLPFAHSDYKVSSTIEYYVADLIETNQARKAEVKSILADLEQEAINQVHTGSPMIWIESSISKGIIGLIASRLVSKYHIPTIVISCKPVLSDLEKETILELIG